MQCGADSIANDILGRFNMSIRAHGECLSHVRDKGIPLLVLGGGGYQPKNVARCWTYDTSALLGIELPDKIPSTDYDYFFQQENTLHVDCQPDVPNLNSQEYLDALLEHTHEQIKCIQIAPNV